MSFKVTVELVKELLEITGWSKAEFSRQSGVAVQTLNSWFKGEYNPAGENKDKAADLISIYWNLISLYRENNSKDFERIPIFNINILAPEEFRADIKVGAEVEQKHLCFRADWLKSIGVEARKAAVFRVTGDNMLPDYPPMSAVLIDLKERQAVPNKDYIIVDDNNLIKLKRVVKRDLEGIHVKDVNDDWNSLDQKGIVIPDIIPVDVKANNPIIGMVKWKAMRV